MKMKFTRNKKRNRYLLNKCLLFFMIAYLCIFAGDNLHTMAYADASVKLSWNGVTDSNLAGYKIYYHIDVSGPPYSEIADIDKSINSYEFSGIEEGYAYYFVVTTYDIEYYESEYSEEVCVAFNVLDTHAPAIYDVGSLNISTDAATITWNTDVASSTQVEYGTTTSYGNLTTFDPILTLSHTLILTDLTPSTLYHFRVRSQDEAGNLAISGDYTFTIFTPGSIIIRDDGIVDNADSGFSVIGDWDTYSVSNFAIYGPDLRYHVAGTGTNKAVWDAELINGPDTYKVNVWYLGHAHLASNAPFTVNHGGMADTVIVNQQINKGRWVSLGVYDFAGDGTENVTLTDDADKGVVADAVKFEPCTTVLDGIVDNTDCNFSVAGDWKTAVKSPSPGFYGSEYCWTFAGFGAGKAAWTAELADGAGFYEVFVWYPIHTDYATNAPYTINHADGSDTVLVDQSINGGQWVSIGIYNFADDGAGSVTLSDDADNYVIADAVRFVRR
ncbi:MAG: fibronectin type III domain-containing protein [Nitrospinota bacterium]